MSNNPGAMNGSDSNSADETLAGKIEATCFPMN
jgi:hypothetical protein